MVLNRFRWRLFGEYSNGLRAFVVVAREVPEQVIPVNIVKCGLRVYTHTRRHLACAITTLRIKLQQRRVNILILIVLGKARHKIGCRKALGEVELVEEGEVIIGHGVSD